MVFLGTGTSVGVPLILRGPGVPAGAEVSTPVSLVDIYPTLLDAVGLETTREQLEILDNLSAEAQREMLIQTLSDSMDIADAMNDMVNAWRYGDIEFLADSLLDDMQDFEELHDAIVVQRNKNWVEEIQELLEKDDDYLIIVGALHLVGEEGVPNLLSQIGHEVVQLHQSSD